MNSKKLSDKQVQAIRQAWTVGGSGCTLKGLAQKYGCSTKTIQRAVNGIKKGTNALALSIAGTAAEVKSVDVRETEGGAQISVGVATADLQSISSEEFLPYLQSAVGVMLLKANTLQCKSGGEAMNAAIKGLEAMRSLYPMSIPPTTMEEAAEWIVKLPDFEPRRFAQCLIDRWKTK